MVDRLLVFIARHARFIPETLVRCLFLLAADISWLLGIGGVRQLERNLDRVLSVRHDGDRVSRRVLRGVSLRAMRSYFVYFSEAMTVGARTKDELMARVRAEGPGLADLVSYTHEHGGSAPLALGHQGNWDYAGFWAYYTLSPVTTVAERLANQEVLDAFIRIRERLGMRILLTGQPGLTDRLRRELSRPHVLVPLLADRDLSRHGEFVRAFGSTIRVARGPATLALDTRLPLYVANLYRERLDRPRRRAAKTSHGYVCVITGPIPIDDFVALPREEAIHAISQAWVDAWSVAIVEHPEDWHMLQPIFLEDLDPDRLHYTPTPSHDDK
ncbi:MAG: phosphatidylinositol mannoside acyltransferase [Bifidobacterium sp.]|jgi:KDO2-lipid IV(A) lauroyltransferase|nr:phosphatidylinositol mannoside acyltransferase [Bifidobacterium sp.]MCI1864542.1 phosphatidylinositol mannoside acyltransferase [Bifidobacterium sp.]